MVTPYTPSRRTLLAASVAGAATLAWPARSAAPADIVVGQTMPYSGPASSYSVIGRAEDAYFRKVNEEGGVGGRKLRLLSLDDAYSPPKTVEQTRRLVEREQVAAIFGTFGTPTNAVIRKYLNAQKVPHLFPTGGATSGMIRRARHGPSDGSRTTTPRCASTQPLC